LSDEFNETGDAGSISIVQECRELETIGEF